MVSRVSFVEYATVSYKAAIKMEGSIGWFVKVWKICKAGRSLSTWLHNKACILHLRRHKMVDQKGQLILLPVSGDYI